VVAVNGLPESVRRKRLPYRRRCTATKTCVAGEVGRKVAGIEGILNQDRGENGKLRQGSDNNNRTEAQRGIKTRKGLESLVCP
jgi:hypothetical protein